MYKRNISQENSTDIDTYMEATASIDPLDLLCEQVYRSNHGYSNAKLESIPSSMYEENHSLDIETTFHVPITPSSSALSMIATSSNFSPKKECYIPNEVKTTATSFIPSLSVVSTANTKNYRRTDTLQVLPSSKKTLGIPPIPVLPERERFPPLHDFGRSELPIAYAELPPPVLTKYHQESYMDRKINRSSSVLDLMTPCSPSNSTDIITHSHRIPSMLSPTAIPNGYPVCPVFSAPLVDVPSSKSNGRLCSIKNCQKRVRSRGLCKAHGGGRRCGIQGCTKSSQGGSLCISHGGGKRCEKEGCSKAAQSRGFCKAHGGGVRCKVPGCVKSSQGNGFCRVHGGGKRCQFRGCRKGAQRQGFCASHGGNRICQVSGCLKNERGALRCSLHGGGKRCLAEGCSKPGRLDGFCLLHNANLVSLEIKCD